MTTTFASNVVDQPVQTRPRPTYGVPAYAPPQPIIVQAPARSGNLLLGLVVLILAAAAGVVGYIAASESAPQAEEVARIEAISANQAYRTGNTGAFEAGRQYGNAQQGQIDQYRTAMRNQRNYNRGYKLGLRDGERSARTPRRRSYGYGGGYRAPRYNWGGYNSDAATINSAVGQAQALADATGAPVDVDIF